MCGRPVGLMPERMRGVAEDMEVVLSAKSKAGSRGEAADSSSFSSSSSSSPAHRSLCSRVEHGNGIDEMKNDENAGPLPFVRYSRFAPAPPPPRSADRAGRSTRASRNKTRSAQSPARCPIPPAPQPRGAAIDRRHVFRAGQRLHAPAPSLPHVEGAPGPPPHPPSAFCAGR